MSAAVRIGPGYAAGVLLVGLVFLVFAIVTVVDTARRPAWQWAQAGANKTTWVAMEVVFLVLMLVVGFFAIASLVVGIVYFASVRPKLQAAERRGPPGTGLGGPAPYGGAGPHAEAGPYAGPPRYPTAARPDLPPFGWYPDPSGRHEQRYWDGTRWTEQVSDGGQQAVDPLPG